MCPPTSIDEPKESTSRDGSEHATIDVLLVADNPTDIRLLKTHITDSDPRLARKTIALTIANDLEEAIASLKDARFDAILLDLGLPNSTGLDTLNRVMKEVIDTPIVILTDAQNDDIAFQAVRCGAHDFLYKDELDTSRLIRSLRYAMARRDRQLKSSVIESADLALLLAETRDDAIHIIFSNEACETLTGYTTSQWQTGGLDLLVDESSPDILPNLASTVIEEGRRKSVEMHCQQADGTYFWNRIELIPLLDHQQRVTHILYSFDDISEQMQWRAKMADLDRISTLGAVSMGVAHEINNPLTFISANIQFALRSLRADTPPSNADSEVLIVEALEDAMEGSRRVKEIVRDLRQLAGRPGDLKFTTEPLPPLQPLRSSLMIARNKLKNKASLVTDFDELPEVMANDVKLGKVFLNILINAAQAIDDGADPRENSVHISARETDGNVVVTIRDSGHGIEEDALEKIFKPFYSTKSDPQGTGLGLAISKHIVNQLDGRIEVESSPGEGTAVSVWLPAIDGSS